MNHELFNVRIVGGEEHGECCRVLQVVSSSNNYGEVECYLLVINSDRELKLVSIEDCEFLGF